MGILPSCSYISTWTLQNSKKKLNGDYTSMLHVVLNISWKQHPTKQLLYDHLPLILQTTQVRHTGHCWRSKNKFISNVLQWTPTHGHTSVGWPIKTYIHQLCADTGCCLQDLTRMMVERDGWQESQRNLWWW